MASSAPELAPEDVALLDRLASRIVELRLELPAILTLETCRPLSLLAGQTMAFFEPFAAAIFPVPDYRRFAALIERRETVEALLRTIEKQVDQREGRRAKGSDAPPPRGADTPVAPAQGTAAPEPPSAPR